MTKRVDLESSNLCTADILVNGAADANGSPTYCRGFPVPTFSMAIFYEKYWLSVVLRSLVMPGIRKRVHTKFRSLREKIKQLHPHTFNKFEFKINYDIHRNFHYH